MNNDIYYKCLSNTEIIENKIRDERQKYEAIIKNKDETIKSLKDIIDFLKKK